MRGHGFGTLLFIGLFCGWSLQLQFPLTAAPEPLPVDPAAAARLRQARLNVATLLTQEAAVLADLRRWNVSLLSDATAGHPVSDTSTNASLLHGVEAALRYNPNPAPAAGQWRCPSPSGCRYVQAVQVFQGFLGEQFSQQRLALMEVMHVVKALGPRYVMVEPLFIVTPHDNNLIEALIQSGHYNNVEDTLLGRYLLPASTIYDVTLLGEYFEHGRIILWSDFQQMFAPGPVPLDLLVMDHGPVPHTAVPCRDATAVDAPAEFYNVSYRITRTRCLQAIRKEGYPITTCRPRPSVGCQPAGRPYREALLTILRGDPGSNVGLFLHRSFLSDRLYQWIEDPDLDYIAIRKKILFSKAVWTKAQTIAQALPRPFVAMHIRRGDKLTPDPYRTLDKAIARLQKVVGSTHSRGVFLMTDIRNTTDLDHFNRSFAALGGVYRYSSDDWRQEVQDMFVEMAVCCMADYFVSSGRAYWASATPSRDIIEVRGLVFSFPKHTTFWFGKPGKRWWGPAIATFTHKEDLLEPTS